MNLTCDQLLFPHQQRFKSYLGNKNLASSVINGDVQNIVIWTNHENIVSHSRT